MSTASALSNWKLSCSDDNQHWETAHIATDQYNWQSGQFRHFDFDTTAQLSLNKVTISGRVALYGALSQTLYVTGTFLAATRTSGYINLRDLTVTSPNFRIATIFNCFGTFDKSLVAVTVSLSGSTGLWGRLLSTIETDYSQKLTLEFVGGTEVVGHFSGAVSHLQTAIVGGIRINAVAWLNLHTANSQWASRGSITLTGSMILTTNTFTTLIRGSSLRASFNAVIPPLISNFRLRTPISGNISATIILATTVSMTGIVPFRVFALFNPTLATVQPFIKLLLPISCRFNPHLDWPTSTRSYAVTYYSTFRSYVLPVVGNIWAVAGPPIRFNLALVTGGVVGHIVAATKVRGTIAATTPTIRTAIYIRVPVPTTGVFWVTLSTLTSTIQIKNFKWFKADSVNWQTANITSGTKGLITIAGRLLGIGTGMASTQVYSQITIVVPIAINTHLQLRLNPVYSGTIRARTLIYGRLGSQVSTLRSAIVGNQNVGRMQLESERTRVAFRLRTVVHITVTIGNSIAFQTQFSSFGRIANRGVMQGTLLNSVSSIFRLHVTVIPTPVYGSFVNTLSLLTSNIFLRMRLVYGRIDKTWEALTSTFKGVYVCRAILSPTTAIVRLNFDFRIFHFAGRLSTTTETFSTRFVTHSKVIGQLHVSLAAFRINMIGNSSPHFRGRINLIIDAYQSSYIPEYNGGIFGKISLYYEKLLYGKLESTTKSIQFVTITGIVPRSISGRLLAQAGHDRTTITGRIPCMGYLVTSTESIRRMPLLGQSAIGTLSGVVELDPFRSAFLGRAAHAIQAVLAIRISSVAVSSPTGLINPLSTRIRGRVKIYGALRTFTQGVNYIYFRGGNQIIGRWIGGDTGPDMFCIHTPCLPEMIQRLGHSFDASDKIYWTMQYVRGNIHACHRFPILGNLNSWLSAWTPGVNPIGGDPTYYTRMLISLHVKVYGRMNISLQSYLDYDSGLAIYAQFGGARIIGTIQKTLNSLQSGFMLSRINYSYGRLAADLKHCNGWFGGFNVLRGSMNLRLQAVTSFIGIKVPLHYQVTFTPVLESCITHLELYTPFQIFGIYQNYYLNSLTATGNFTARIPTYAKFNLFLSDFEEVNFYGKMLYVTGTFIPTAKLERAYGTFIALTPEPGEYVGFTTGYFITGLTNAAVTGNFQALAKLYVNLRLITRDDILAIVAKTPIRIWTYWHNSLGVLTGIVTGVVWPTGRLAQTLQAVTTNLTTQYYPPRYVTLALITAPVTGGITARTLIAGHISSTLSSFTTTILVYHCTIAFIELTTTTLTATMIGAAYQAALYMPEEAIYTVSGEVTNRLNTKRSYFLVLYDRSTTQLVQKLPVNQQVPFDYSFGNVVAGHYFVVCKPAQVTVGSQVKTLEVTDENESRFIT